MRLSRNGSLLGKSNSATMLELQSDSIGEFKTPMKPAPKKSELLQSMTSDLRDLLAGGKPQPSPDRWGKNCISAEQDIERKTFAHLGAVSLSDSIQCSATNGMGSGPYQVELCLTDDICLD